jgi:hypothetical protein
VFHVRLNLIALLARQVRSYGLLTGFHGDEKLVAETFSQVTVVFEGKNETVLESQID